MECNDKKCYKHGNVRVRGATLVGKVVSVKPKRSAVVQIDIFMRMPKYHRIERRRSRLLVHNPDCISAKVGDTVKIGETRKLSKTKSWTILEIIKG